MPQLRFGLQGPRYFPEGGPTLGAEEEAAIEEIVSAYLRSGNLQPSEAEKYRSSLRSMVIAANNGDDAAAAQLAREANGASQVPQDPSEARGLPAGLKQYTFGGKTKFYREEPIYENEYNAIGDVIGRKQIGTKPVMFDEEAAGGGDGGGYASTALRDLEEAAKRAEAAGDKELAAQYRARAQRILLEIRLLRCRLVSRQG